MNSKLSGKKLAIVSLVPSPSSRVGAVFHCVSSFTLWVSMGQNFDTKEF